MIRLLHTFEATLIRFERLSDPLLEKRGFCALAQEHLNSVISQKTLAWLDLLRSTWLFSYNDPRCKPSLLGCIVHCDAALLSQEILTQQRTWPRRKPRYDDSEEALFP